jgi:hypothetical protein
MRDQIETRLTALRQEFETGRKLLAQYREQLANTEQTMLRISGAIQVCEDLLAAAGDAEEGASDVEGKDA